MNNPTAPPPGDKLDSNFDLTNLAITQQLAWASVSLNSDGTVRDAILDANNFVPGLFDQVSQDIIDDVQPLVTEAQSYASQAQISAANAEAEATSAAGQAANAAASRDAAQVAAAEAEGSETAAALSETAATNAKVAAETAAGAAMGSEDQAMLFADLAGAWAEHMPDTIPPEVLAVNAITGDHWSSRWWANKANQAFGAAGWYYAGAGPTPPLFTVTGDPLPIGAIWFDTSIPPGTIRIWNGNAWIAAAPSSLPPNSINTIHLIDGCVTTPKIADGACTLAKLAPNSVDSSKIVDGSIALADLGPNSVDSSKIVNGSIQLIDLGAGSVDSSKIVDGSIDPVDLSAATLNLIATANPFDQVLNKASAVQFASTKFGGATAAFPMLKPNGVELQARLADDSAFADFHARDTIFRGMNVSNPNNGPAASYTQNSDPGNVARAAWLATNGLHYGGLFHYGTGYVTGAFDSAKPDGTLILGTGAGGVAYESSVAGAPQEWWFAGIKKMWVDGLTGLLNVPGGVAAPNISNKNFITNGDFKIDQRNGYSQFLLNNNNFLADRFQYFCSQANKFNFQARNIATAGGAVGSPISTWGSFDSAGVYVSSGNDLFDFAQYFEGYDLTEFLWGTPQAKNAVLSFYAYSSVAGDFSVVIRNVPGTHSFLVKYNIPTAGLFYKIVVPIPGPTVGTWATGSAASLVIDWTLDGSGTSLTVPTGAWTAAVLKGAVGQTKLLSSAGSAFAVTAIKLELGNVATPFVPLSMADALAVCQRHYYLDTVTRNHAGWLDGGSSDYITAIVDFPVAMRVAPAGSFVSIGSMSYSDSTNAAKVFTPAGGTPDILTNTHGGHFRLNLVSNPQGATNVYKFGYWSFRAAFSADP